jgi:hypothetical protein
MTADLEVTLVVPGDLVDSARDVDMWAPLSTLGRIATDTAHSDTDRFEAALVAAIQRTPRPIEVGDPVRMKDGSLSSLRGEILCIHEAQAMGRWANSPWQSYWTRPLAELALLEDEDA